MRSALVPMVSSHAVSRPRAQRVWLRHLVRLVVSAIVRVLYRVRLVGPRSLPEVGPAIVVANHPSYVDAMVLTALCPYPLRFAYWSGFDRVFFVGSLFRFMGGIPIGKRSEDPAVYDAAMREMARSLDAGEIVGIFPEGTLSRDGSLGAFRTGVERLLARRPTRVVPVGIRGLWGSIFSKSATKRARRFRPVVRVEVGEALAAGEVSAARLHDAVKSLAA